MSNHYHKTLVGPQNQSSQALDGDKPVKTSAFSDVKEKGKRIFDNDLYDIWQINTYSVLIDVLGDNDVYTVYINDRARVDKYEMNTPFYWQCTCMWADWAFNRINYHGRICSHVYCGYLLLREAKKMNLKSSSQESVLGDNAIDFGTDFESTDEELIYNIVYESVLDDFDAFYTYITEGFATHNVTSLATTVLFEHDIEIDELEDIIKLCLMRAQAVLSHGVSDNVTKLEYKIIEEELEEMGIPLNDDELLESELFEESDIDELLEEEKTARLKKARIKRAGRIFTEEEKIALIEEDGISRHVINGLFL